MAALPRAQAPAGPAASPRMLPPQAIDAYLSEVECLLNLSGLSELSFDDSVTLLRVAHDRLKDVTSVAEYSRPGPRILFLNAQGHVVSPAHISPDKVSRNKPKRAKT